MSKVARTVVVGLGGAVQGIVLLAIACAIIAMIPPVVVSLANRGTVDLDAYLPYVCQNPSASAQVKVDGTPQEQAAIRKALNELMWPVDPSAFTVKVVPKQQLPPNDMGMYVYPESVIYIDAEVVDDPVRESLPHVLAHELGHMVDVQYLTDDARAQFMSVRGFAPSSDWTGGPGAAWATQPQEDFAEVYAALDAPFTIWTIRTVGGRVQDPTSMRDLIEQYQPGTSRPTESLDVSALVSKVSSVLDLVKNDMYLLEGLFGLAAFYACAFAIRSMGHMHWL
jgi:hypothetical protein